jgi:hypothetical protein
MAWALSKTRWTQRTHTTFVPVVDQVTRGALAINDYDFAARHDDPQALEALGERLAKNGTLVDAWLLPPSLGVRGHARQVLEEQVGVPVGEHMGLPGGPSGARFEFCRNELFTARGVKLRAKRVAALESHVAGFRVRFVGASESEAIYDRVVLAVGGVVAGGVAFGPPRRDAAAGLAFQLGLTLPAPLRLGGQEIDFASSLHGFDSSRLGLDALERVGVASEGGTLRELPGLFPAGDVIADRPRTVLEAARSGCRAADLALSS